MRMYQRSLAIPGKLRQLAFPCSHGTATSDKAPSQWAEVIVPALDDVSVDVNVGREAFVRRTAAALGQGSVYMPHVFWIDHLGGADWTAGLSDVSRVSITAQAVVVQGTLTSSDDNVTVVAAATVVSQLPVVVRVYSPRGTDAESEMALLRAYLANMFDEN